MAVVVVVGGAAGIGRATAELLVGRGDLVAVLDLRHPVNLPAGVDFCVEVDARDAEAVSDAFDRVERHLGPVDGVVCTAGTARVTPLLEISRKEWDLVLSVNLTGTMTVLVETSKRLTRSGRPGAFVALSSVDSGRPVAGLGHYCASKAAVESLVRVAALELGPAGIRVNVVAPGIVETPLMVTALAEPEVRDDFLRHIPLGRLGEPQDVAEAIAFLLSDKARYITGQVVVVDGGMSLREHALLLRGGPP